MSARARVILVSLAVLLTGGIVVYGASADDQPADSVSTVPMLGAVPSSLATEYGVFRRTTTANDSLAKVVSADSDYVTQLGLNPRLARRIPTLPGVSTLVWLAPTANGSCLFVQQADAIGPGGSCGTEMTSNPYGSADSYTSRDGSFVDVVGLVGDGVKAVTVVLADGSQTEVPVADNVYVAQLSSAPSEVQLTDPEQGAVTVPVAGYGPDATALR